jgi:hypothetical protein
MRTLATLLLALALTTPAAHSSSLCPVKPLSQQSVAHAANAYKSVLTKEFQRALRKQGVALHSIKFQVSSPRGQAMDFYRYDVKVSLITGSGNDLDVRAAWIKESNADLIPSRMGFAVYPGRPKFSREGQFIGCGPAKIWLQGGVATAFNRQTNYSVAKVWFEPIAL